MAKTYSELTQQIHQLQIQAEARRLSEAKGVIRTINEAIATYGLTAADLKFAQAVPSPVVSPAASPVAPKKAGSAAVPKSAAPAVVKSGGQGYSDGAGNSWTGRGPRPKWLREALAKGDSLSKFEVTSSSKPPVIAPKAASKKAAVASASAKKSASASTTKAKTAPVPAKSANALKATTAQAHVPAVAEKNLGDAGVTAAPAEADLIPAPAQVPTQQA